MTWVVAVAGTFSLFAMSAGAAKGPSTRGVPTCHGEPATFVGYGSDDTFQEESGVFVLRGGDDRVTLTDPDEDSIVCGGWGDDRVKALGGRGRGEFLLDGGSGHDKLRGTPQCDTCEGFLGPMRLLGGGGPDLLVGDRRPDVLDGGPGRDQLLGRAQDDVLRGGSRSDRLSGDPGDDRLYGGAGDDYLDGDRPLGRDDPPPMDFDVADGGPNRDRCEAERTRRCEA